MLKYLSQKLRTQSISEGNVQEKIDEHDSGTESDGVLEADERPTKRNYGHSFKRHPLPSYTACSSESHSFLNIVTSTNCLMYDQHSSEEELEVINGPIINSRVDELSENLFDVDSFKSSNSAIIESRKRSLAQSSDDEVRNFFDHIPAPVVNFRTSPPLEALKPHRGNIMYRSATPLILTDSGRGLESIKISCDSPDNSMDNIQSISPPAKLFHCSVSPRRRQIKIVTQRAQRPHRPCLDFDKMQQVTKIA